MSVVSVKLRLVVAAHFKSSFIERLLRPLQGEVK
jgi:hypothetical protein